jgi:hypothetical protein
MKPRIEFTDRDFTRWKQHSSAEEILELAVFTALADGFGKIVEDSGSADQVCKFEI